MSAATIIRKASDGRNQKPRRCPTAQALVGLVLMQVVLSSNAQAGDDRWNWGYCAPPYPPACAGAPARTPKDRLSCDQSVEQYIASVFRYRACLASETERAVREANRVLQITRCPKDKRYCFDLPQVDPSPGRTRGGH